jgi:hypothetical protein
MKSKMQRASIQKDKKYGRRNASKYVIEIKPPMSRKYSQLERQKLKEFERTIMGYK